MESSEEETTTPAEDDDDGSGGVPIRGIVGATLGSLALVAGSTMLVKHRRNLHPPPDPFEDPTNGLNNENP